MSLSIIRCAKIIGTQTITNGSRRRTTTCWNGRRTITRRGRSSTARKISRRIPNERDNSNTRTGRTSADDNELATRRGAARSLDGAAASIYPRRFSDERRARRRDRAQAQAGLWLSPSQPRKNRRERQLSRLDAVHRSARLFLFDDEQLGLRAERGKTRRHRSSRTRRIFASYSGRADT